MSIAVITICKYYVKRQHVFDVLCPAGPGPSVKSKVSALPPCCITPLWRHTQNRKFAPISIITEAKKLIFCVQTNWVCQSDAWKVCKDDSDSSHESLLETRVESFGEKRDSSRVTIVSQRDSSRVIDWNHAITAVCGNRSYQIIPRFFESPLLLFQVIAYCHLYLKKKHVRVHRESLQKDRD